MAEGSGSNEERLRAIGLINPENDALPQEYAALVDSLTPDELELLISVKKRLNEAERVSGVGSSNVFLAP